MSGENRILTSQLQRKYRDKRKLFTAAENVLKKDPSENGHISIEMNIGRKLSKQRFMKRDGVVEKVLVQQPGEKPNTGTPEYSEPVGQTTRNQWARLGVNLPQNNSPPYIHVYFIFIFLYKVWIFILIIEINNNNE